MWIAPGATVAQVNAALASVGGTIAGAVAGSPQLVVTIPDPGTLAALEDLLDALRAMPGIERATLADLPATNELPTGFASPLSATGGAALGHLVALRMPAAWNARRAIRLADRPTLIVADMFGDGPFSSHIDATYNSGALQQLTTSTEHGYHVVGIAASGFATNGTAAGNVTGVFPATMQLHVIEGIGSSTQMTGVRIIQQAKARTGRVVVNTSLGYLVIPPDAEVRQAGSDWAQLVRATAGLEDRILHATSAGNDAGPSSRNSRWTASLRADLTDAAGQPMPPLRNTLSVENLVETPAPAFEPGCLAVTSNRGGNIAVVGTDVHSHLFGSAAGDKTGTSMASPQVAGLAMYLWSIAPDLTGPQVRARDDRHRAARAVQRRGRVRHRPAVRAAPGRLRRRAEPGHARRRRRCAPRSSTATPTADFDEHDLELFSDVARSDAGDRDHSRSDLNGDGFTGGTATAALDLDLTGSPRGGAPRLETVRQGIENVSVEFDEAAVTDMQALCFYAYSDLYTGSPDRRVTLLEPRERCGAEQRSPTASSWPSAVARAASASSSRRRGCGPSRRPRRRSRSRPRASRRGSRHGRRTASGSRTHAPTGSRSSPPPAAPRRTSPVPSSSTTIRRGPPTARGSRSTDAGARRPASTSSTPAAACRRSSRARTATGTRAGRPSGA